MNRKEREVTDRQEIVEILEKCDTIRIAMSAEGSPYIVPVSFGFEVTDGKIVIYFHCAKHGMKVDILTANPKVCIEGDQFIAIEKTEHGITTRYESIIGFGECSFVSEPEEMIHGLHLLTSHYGYDDYPLDRCRGMAQVMVGKIEIEKIYGKRNLPDSLTAADAAN